MNTTLLRSPKVTYLAAFVLGAVIALLIATPARSAEPFRLDRLAIVRFVSAADNQLILRHGVPEEVLETL